MIDRPHLIQCLQHPAPKPHYEKILLVDIVNILLITPFSNVHINVVVEQMFSAMRVMKP